MEVKPICVIYFPDLFSEGRDRSWIYQYMKYLNGEQGDGSMKWDDRKDYWNQYYWFCFYKEDILSPEIVVHNTKDITPAKIEELTAMVNEAIEKIITK